MEAAEDVTSAKEENGFTRFVGKLVKIRDSPFVFLANRPRLTKILVWSLVLGLYTAYLVGCLVRLSVKNYEWEWCDGLGFLVIITLLVYIGLFYFLFFKPLLGDRIDKAVIQPFMESKKSLEKTRPTVVALFNAIIGLVIFAAVLVYLIIDSWDEPERLISAGGALALIVIGAIFSAHPAHIRWRHVFWGLGLEFLFGLIVLRWDVGRNIFRCIGDKATTFLSFSEAGSGFVFGWLVTGTPFIPDVIEDPEIQKVAMALNNNGTYTPINTGVMFMFKSLSVIYFFSFVVSMLFYWGALQWVVIKMGWLLSVTVGTTAGESLNAAANIFLGQTEAPLLIRPFLNMMTKSEIHAVMTGGFATIAGTVLAAYINFGIDADKLIAASVMAAPAALAVSKLFYPETEKSKTTVDDIKIEKGQEANVIDAAAQGASTAIMLVLNIAASLIAFLAFVEFLNTVINWFGLLAGVEGLDLPYFLGKIFIPLSYLMGVPSKDAEKVAELVGIKTTVNEFIAFSQLAQYKDELSPRAVVIATYACCGFANPASIGIQLGGLGAMAPERKKDLAQVVIRAFFAGCFTSFLNACVAGALTSSPK